MYLLKWPVSGWVLFFFIFRYNEQNHQAKTELLHELQFSAIEFLVKYLDLERHSKLNINAVCLRNS